MTQPSNLLTGHRFRPLEAPLREALGVAVTGLVNMLVFGLFHHKTFVDEAAWGPGQDLSMPARAKQVESVPGGTSKKTWSFLS